MRIIVRRGWRWLPAAISTPLLGAVVVLAALAALPTGGQAL